MAALHSYKANAAAGIAALQQWYRRSTGLWESTGWWNAANALWVVIDYSSRTNTTTYLDVLLTTFGKQSKGNFLNKFYDDEGWWALSWMKAYDLTGDIRYLSMAKTLFLDMLSGWDTICGGGIWWSKDRTYKNAIANALFLTLAARLSQRLTTTEDSRSCLEWASQGWNWFQQSGMLNSHSLVNDGLDSSCQNNGQTPWTYNQGVLIGGLVELYRITKDNSYLTTAEAIANATIRTLVDTNGVLQEPCEASDCGADGPQFKGIFIRNLSSLYEVDTKEAYKAFIMRNADSIWQKNRNDRNQFGLKWSGPVDSVDAARQSSALDALNAAIPFST